MACVSRFIAGHEQTQIDSAILSGAFLASNGSNFPELIYDVSAAHKPFVILCFD